MDVNKLRADAESRVTAWDVINDLKMAEAKVQSGDVPDLIFAYLDNWSSKGDLIAETESLVAAYEAGRREGYAAKQGEAEAIVEGAKQVGRMSVLDDIFYSKVTVHAFDEGWTVEHNEGELPRRHDQPSAAVLMYLDEMRENQHDIME